MLRLSANGRRGNLLLEILMIVVGINVALWFEGWFQDLRDDLLAMDDGYIPLMMASISPPWR
jgi:hypothetical protein